MSKRGGLEPEELIIEVRAELESDACEICREAEKNPIIKPCGNCGWVFQEFKEAIPRKQQSK
tara:strand:- start:181 stop:366 length:186 start_codon:yes stop_codon:yes gene_type:complete